MSIYPIPDIRKRTGKQNRTTSCFSFIGYLTFGILFSQSNFLDFEQGYFMVSSIHIPEQGQSCLVS